MFIWLWRVSEEPRFINDSGVCVGRAKLWFWNVPQMSEPHSSRFLAWTLNQMTQPPWTLQIRDFSQHEQSVDSERLRMEEGLIDNSAVWFHQRGTFDPRLVQACSLNEKSLSSVRWTSQTQRVTLNFPQSQLDANVTVACSDDNVVVLTLSCSHAKTLKRKRNRMLVQNKETETAN